MFVYVKYSYELPRRAIAKYAVDKAYKVLSSNEKYITINIPQEDGGVKQPCGEFGWQIPRHISQEILFNEGDVIIVDDNCMPTFCRNFNIAFEVAYQDCYHVVVKCPQNFGGYETKKNFKSHWKVSASSAKKANKDSVFFFGKKVKVKIDALKNLPVCVSNKDFVFTIGSCSDDSFFLYIEDQDLGYSLNEKFFIDDKKRSGFWINKEHVLHASDEDIKKFEDLLAQKAKNDKIVASHVFETTEFSFSSKEVRNYEMLLPNLVNLAKSIFKWAVAFALKQFGKTSKKITSYMEVIEDLVDTNKDAANSLFRWILGIASKYAHKIRALPGMDRIEFLQILESEQLKKFGQYAESVSEGEVIGTLVAKTLSWVQEKISSSNLSEKFGKILEGQVDATAVARFATDFSSHLESETNDVSCSETAQMTAAM